MNDPHHVLPTSDAAHEQGINVGKIIAVGVASLAAFAICTVAARGIMVRFDAPDEAEKPADAKTTLIGKDEIGIVDHVPFDGDHRLEDWRATQKKRLESYGWVDRKKGLIHIPIDVAMKEVVQQSGGGAGK